MAKLVDPFAEIDASQRKLLAQLAASPIENVLGVVIPHYGFGFHDRTDNKWTYLIIFGAWRIEGGTVKTQQLTIRRTNLTENAVHKLKESLVPYAVVRIRARVLPVKFSGTWQAQMEKFFGPDNSDAALNDLASELKKPVKYTDKILGKLSLDRALHRFEGETRWRGLPKLMSVELGRTKVTDCGVKALSGYKFLYGIGLNDTQITDQGLSYLAAIRNLLVLDVSGTRITDAGVATLKTFPSLTTLSLKRTRVTDAGLSHLAEFPKLFKVNLEQTRVTQAGIADLQRAMPDLVIKK